jgi:hypothetical protein
LAKITIRIAGFLLLSALALSAATSAQAASDCKTSRTAVACPSPKDAKPHILPNPPPVAKSPPAQAATHPASPTAPKQANDRPSQPQPKSRLTRHTVRHRTYAGGPSGYHYESRQEWETDDGWWTATRQEQRPRSGPIYESGPAPGGCEEACQYNDWFRRYRDWYDHYGRDYQPGRGSAMNVPPNPSYRPAPSDIGPAGNYRGRPLDRSERDRMDPWHGYNAHDGLENGY